MSIEAFVYIGFPHFSSHPGSSSLGGLEVDLRWTWLAPGQESKKFTVFRRILSIVHGFRTPSVTPPSLPINNLSGTYA